MQKSEHQIIVDPSTGATRDISVLCSLVSLMLITDFYLGHEETLVREMSNRDPEWYFMYFRMDCDQFEWILKRLRPVLERKYVVREPLSAKLRLMVTL
uniref:Uncharacterized protein n=1 Tax=Phlebotomus papatasi TaxID=29031 RepID=A0A1B0GQ14_PHLPP